MKIILNEKVLLNKSLNDGYIDKKPSITIKLLAKHFFKIGQDKEQVIDSIDNFMSNNYKKYNFMDWQDTIKRIVGKVGKLDVFEFINISNIIIYQDELDLIKNIDNLRLEKLAFVLLVYSKIYNQMNNNETNWVNSNLRDIFSDTKMTVSKKDQNLMINKLGNMGLLEVSRIVDCTNMKVLFTKNKGKIAIVICDFRDFIYEYLDWVGYKIDICEGKDCHRLIMVKNNRQKYCNICWKKKVKELSKETSRKYREKLKSDSLETINKPL